LQDDKSEGADKAKPSDSTDSEKKAMEVEEKKQEVKTKTTLLRANITWQTTLRDIPDPTGERLKQSKKLYVALHYLDTLYDLTFVAFVAFKF